MPVPARRNAQRATGNDTGKRKAEMLRILRRYGLFAGGSALGAVVDYAVTLGAVGLFGLSSAVALGLAMLVSATGVFFWHEHITFGAAGTRGKSRRYAAFMLWSGVVFALRAAMLLGFQTLGLPLPVALAAAIAIASIINYMLSSWAIFRPRG